MKSKPIKLRIDASIQLPRHCPAELPDILIGDEAEDYLYDQLCSWIWRYVPPTLAGFDLAVSVTALE